MYTVIPIQPDQSGFWAPLHMLLVLGRDGDQSEV
jgi:hypothetical protein